MDRERPATGPIGARGYAAHSSVAPGACGIDTDERSNEDSNRTIWLHAFEEKTQASTRANMLEIIQCAPSSCWLDCA